MNRLTTDKRCQIVAALVEGNSIRATCRITGAAKNTVTKLLADLGWACELYQIEVFKNLPCKRVQCDEIWSFCYAKDKNVPEHKKDVFGYGDVWTWVALDADTKLVPCWRVGLRDEETAIAFIQDLADRLANRVQLATDGFSVYLEAVDDVFEGEIDYAMLRKIYGTTAKYANQASGKYNPARQVATRRRVICGAPDSAHISTSYVERQNLTMRMGMRRFTRLTNGFSKKVENHACAVALHFTHYNFCRIHRTLKTTPAVAAGVADHVWGIGKIVGLLESEPANRQGAKQSA